MNKVRKKFVIQDFSVWLVSAFAGVLFILFLNLSPLGALTIGIETPFGWKNSEEAKVYDPSLFYSCQTGNYHKVGIPFARERPNELDDCYADHNNLSFLLNGFVGVILGPAVILLTEIRWPKK